MAKVTIRFEEIFLFAVRKNCLTVLAPKSTHRCFLSGPDLPEMELTDHVVTLLKGRQRAKGKIKNKALRHMVHLDDVLGKDGYQLKDNTALMPGLVPAVFELGGEVCSLVDRPLSPPTGDPKYRDVMWRFGGHFAHRLTNRAEFVLQAGPAYRLEIKERAGTVITTIDLEGGETFVARTEDQPRPAMPDRRTLKEFALIYDFLLDRDGEPLMGPIPYDPKPETAVARARRLGRPRDVGGSTPRCIEPVCPNSVCSAP